MRTTVTLDDDLVAKAIEMTGEKNVSRLVAKALEALVAREAAHRLAKLAGTDPSAKAAPRRRSAVGE